MSTDSMAESRDHEEHTDTEMAGVAVEGVNGSMSVGQVPVAVKVSTPSTVAAEAEAAQQQSPAITQTGYFTSNPAASEQQEQYSNTIVAGSSPSPTVSASDVTAEGLIEPADSLSPLQSQAYLERPAPHSTHSSLSIKSVDSAATITAPTSAPQLRPAFPNQSYAALSSQVHPPPYPAPPLLKQRSSHPGQIHTLGQIHTFTSAVASRVHHSGSRTVGNSPAVTPGPGLFNHQPYLPLASEYDPPATPGTYASPFLHFMQRVPPKETHVADVEVDPVSGRKLINHYEIMDELGRGTHGKVKLGRDLDNNGAYVAVKIVERYSRRRKLGKLGTTEDKVKKEVAILKQARHPNVVGLLEVIDDPSRKKVYIVLEWVERGEIQWRAKAPKEVAMVEARRYEREKSGRTDARSEAEDAAVQAEALRRLDRQKRRVQRAFRRMRQDVANDEAAWSVELAGDDTSDLSDDDKLSRISTESYNSKLLFDPARRGSRAPSPLAESAHPNTARAQQYLPLTNEPQTLSPTTSRVDFGDIHTGLEGTMYGAYIPESRVTSANNSIHSLRAWPNSKSNSENLAQLASEILDSDLNPELDHVPMMTMQQTRVAFRDTLLGLQYLHYQGIIHRDIKPPNLLATKDHRVKISDFGVSYLGRPIHEGEAGEEVSEHETQEVDDAKELAKTVGTPAFYAPELCITEVLDDPPPITKAIDVWALGVTLFCMLFARTPFVDNEFVVMRQIADEEIYIPRKRLRPVDAKPRSRPSSHGRGFQQQPSGLRHELDLSYEEINDELYDLLKRLLTKDPKKRISLEEVRHHAWVVADIQDKVAWLEETDPTRQNQGKKISVSKEDVNSAVVPLQFLDRVRSQVKKFGERLGLGGGGGAGRTRAQSNTGSREGGSPTASTSPAASRDGRSHSLRGDEQILTALKASREGEHHPLSRSVNASPEMEHNPTDFEGSTVRPESALGAVEQRDYSTPPRPEPPERATTMTATGSGSMRTVRQDDFRRSRPIESPPPSPGLPGTPVAFDSSGGFGTALGGSMWRGWIKTVRERSIARSTDTRSPSSDRGSIHSVDMHADASIASSQASAIGHVNPPSAFDDFPPPSLPSSAQVSPVASPSRPMSLTSSPSRDQLSPPFGEHEALSRVSSGGSISSVGRRAVLQNIQILHSPVKTESGIPPESTEEDWTRAKDEHIRKLVREQEAAESESQPSSPFDNRTCPPSPDDQHRRAEKARNLSEPDILTGESSHGTSPTTQSSQLPPPMVSSTSDFGSAVSVSMSNPSIPSVISEASSIDLRDEFVQPTEVDEKTDLMSSDDTLNPRPQYREEVPDEGYTADDNVAVQGDEEEFYDDSSDSDGGLVMSRRKSAPKAPPESAAKDRREASLTLRSRKSSRSGSSNTMKKVRSQDSEGEHAAEASAA